MRSLREKVHCIRSGSAASGRGKNERQTGCGDWRLGLPGAGGGSEHFHELSADHFSAAVSGGICAEHRGDGAAADRLGAGVVDFDGSAASGYFHGEHRQICGGG